MPKCKQGHCGMKIEKTKENICCFYCEEKSNCDGVCGEIDGMRESKLPMCNNFISKAENNLNEYKKLIKLMDEISDKTEMSKEDILKKLDRMKEENNE